MPETFMMKRARQKVVVENQIPQTSQKNKKQKTCFGESDPLAPVDWGSLPHHVILCIFQFLPLVDRARASSVCRRWNEVFHIPDLWRRFEFELTQPATSYLKSTHPDLIQQIIKKHADHLQYVSFKVKSRMSGASFHCVAVPNVCSFSVGWLKSCTWKALYLKTQLCKNLPHMHAVSDSTLYSPKSKERVSIMWCSTED